MKTYEIESLAETTDETETLSIPIAICFTPTEAKRWERIKNELREINKKNKISNYARPTLMNMMDRLEYLISEQKAGKCG